MTEQAWWLTIRQRAVYWLDENLRFVRPYIVGVAILAHFYLAFSLLTGHVPSSPNNVVLRIVVAIATHLLVLGFTFSTIYVGLFLWHALQPLVRAIFLPFTVLCAAVTLPVTNFLGMTQTPTRKLVDDICIKGVRDLYWMFRYPIRSFHHEIRWRRREWIVDLAGGDRRWWREAGELYEFRPKLERWSKAFLISVPIYIIFATALLAIVISGK